MTSSKAQPEPSREVVRLRTELEQATVTIEDMEERLAELDRSNVELAAANERLEGDLAKERALREQAEARLQLQGLMAEAEGKEAILRQELSVVLEELQVMQEELQTAHANLAARDTA